MFKHRVKTELNPDSFIELSRKINSEIMPSRTEIKPAAVTGKLDKSLVS